MSVNDHITISKTNQLPPAQDYYYLRKEGLRLIEKLGSKLWTDYNIHDPGITFLEVLSYALTDLSYRASFSVKDLIAEEKPALLNAGAQTFFTAREILTTAPWTINDYRKLLIDMEEIRNAWIKCNNCNCGPRIYVNCKKSELTLHKSEIQQKKIIEIIPKGLYNVLLELDKDEQYGDLNTGKVSIADNFLIAGKPETLYPEVRFPSSQELNKLQKNNKIIELFRYPESEVRTIKAKTISNKKNASSDIIEGNLITALRGGMYVTLEIGFDEYVTTQGAATSQIVTFKDVPLRFVLLKNEVRQNLTLTTIRKILENSSASGIASRYLLKIQLADNAIRKATETLNSYRNIAEDFCSIEEIEIEEVGVCADIELTPNADIEQVLAEVYYLIEEYLNPAIPFRTLETMLEKKTVDKIFEGPKLEHGFIEDEDMDKNVLNRSLFSSDIINLIMEIPGIISIKNFVLIRFDKEGNNIGSDPWKMIVTSNNLPRLYLEGSKILVFKNGLPFLPDTAELIDTMNVVRSRNTMPKLKDHDLDLDIPSGNWYPMQEYKPVQNSLPLVYGTGYESLSPNVPDLRKSQAKQLKAYLTFFDQLLVSYLGQLANLKHLFSIDNGVKHTYFPVFLSDEFIKNDLYNDLSTDFYNNFDKDKLAGMTESKDLFLERRNKFLDHLLARFSESFSDYALLLYSYKTQKKIASENLIHAKTSFLKQFPYQSAFKAQSFNYINKKNICLSKDLSGIHYRISALLGLQNSLNYFDYNISKTDDDKYTSSLILHDSEGNILLILSQPVVNKDRDHVIQQINFYITRILKYASDLSSYKVRPSGGKFIIELGNPVIAVSGNKFNTNTEAKNKIDAIIDFAGNQLMDDRFIIVEHILLRPHKTGDPLLPVCVDSNCDSCGEEDPYSYRLTFVFDGESELAQKHFSFRKFAENTIRSELPAHLLAKICWVKHDVFVAFEDAYCNWLNASKTSKSSKLEKLITVFKTLKSIYPSPALHDCMDGEEVKTVLLNQTQL